MVIETPVVPAIENQRPAKRQVFSGVVGMMLELYDWQVYGIMSVYIAAQVFSKEDSLSALLSTLMIFAVGFFVRPIGGAIIGAFADKHGRRSGMILGMVLLGIGSLMMALVPTYAVAGPWAAAILLVARLLQGLGVGGEQGAAVSFLSEIAPPGKRGLYNAFGYVASSVAVIFATGLAALLPIMFGPQGTAEWAWRIPFLLGALFTVYAVVMRRTMGESEVFLESKVHRDPDFRPVRALLTTYIRPTLLTFFFISGGTFFYYTVVLQYANFAHLKTGLALGNAQLLSLIVLVLFAALQPVFGLLSDKFGRRRVLLVASIAMLISLWPTLLLLTNDPALFLVLQLLGTIPAAATASVGSAALAELFPTEVRGVGVALPYAVSVALFGGTAPYLVTWFTGTGQVPLLAVYGTILLSFTIIAIIRMKDRSQEELL